MKKVNYEQFLSFNPCWQKEENKAEQLRQYAEQQAEWSALDILGLEEVSIEDRMWAVMRPELIDEPVIHEFACRCAEYALTFVEEPDPRRLAAIAARRKWLTREITDDELRAARDAEWDASCASMSAAAKDTARGHELDILIELLSYVV